MATDDLDRALADAERLLLDSSTVMAFHSPHEVAHPLAEHVLQRIERETDPARGYLSVISLTELLVRPHRTSQARFTYMHEFLINFPNLTILPMDETVAAQAATIRTSMRLALPDSVVIASGMLAGCEAIVSNYARWKQRGARLFPQFRWIYLNDYL